MQLDNYSKEEVWQVLKLVLLTSADVIVERYGENYHNPLSEYVGRNKWQLVQEIFERGLHLSHDKVTEYVKRKLEEAV